MLTKQFIINGVVQGVGFRYFVAVRARRLGLAGYVKNLVSGQVEVVVQGSESSISALFSYCNHGPAGSRVTGIEETEVYGAKRFAGFDVKM